MGDDTRESTDTAQRQKPRLVLTGDNLSLRPSFHSTDDCSVCGVKNCALTAHRILVLEIQKRVAKFGSRKKGLKDDQKQNHSTSKNSDLDEGATYLAYNIPDMMSVRGKTRRRLCQSSSRQIPCRVCHSLTCKLVSHQRYAGSVDVVASNSSMMTLTSSDKALKHLSSSRSGISRIPIIDRAVPASVRSCLSDPNLQLPNNVSNKTVTQLFYDFFTVKSQLITCRERTGLSFARDVNDFFLAQALADDTLCMSIVSLSLAFSVDRHAQAGIESSLQQIQIYNQACRLISRDLESGPTQSTLVAALAMTVAQGTFPGNRAATRAHVHGARSIISSLGGFTRIKGGFVHLFHDIVYSATLLDVDVTDIVDENYCDDDDYLKIIPLQDPPKSVYGCNFLHLAEILNHKLCLACVDSCRLTELLEDQATAQTDLGTPNQFRWTYFQYLRDVLFVRLTRLHTVYRNTNTIEECISLAINLYTLSVLNVSPYRAPQLNLCTRIQTILTCPMYFQELISNGSTNANMKRGKDSTLVTLQSVIVWILFVTSAVLQQVGSMSDEWVLDLILNLLSARFQLSFYDWPGNWRDDQLALLKGFCWSEVFFTKSYNTTCDMLVVHASAKQSNADTEYAF